MLTLWFSQRVRGVRHHQIIKIGLALTMHIDFEYSGGFANLCLTYHADTERLPLEVKEEILRLVESSRIFELEQSEVAPTSAGPPDVFSYRLSLSESGRRKFLSFNDVTAPASLQPLLRLLRKLALDQRRQGK